jgi:hypothetical protein
VARGQVDTDGGGAIGEQFPRLVVGQRWDGELLFTVATQPLAAGDQDAQRGHRRE